MYLLLAFAIYLGVAAFIERELTIITSGDLFPKVTCREIKLCIILWPLIAVVIFLLFITACISTLVNFIRTRY